jgi:undecaprenyl-diphosphatase
LNDVFVFLTRIGTYGLVWIVLALVLALVRRSVWPFLLTAAAVYAAELIADLLKLVVGEKRPTGTHPLVAVPHSNSFPSGHTATAFAGATMLSYFVPRAAPALYLLAAAIGYSRLYLGVHYPLDVLGGAVIGVATALLLLAAVRRRSARVLQSG